MLRRNNKSRRCVCKVYLSIPFGMLLAIAQSGLHIHFNYFQSLLGCFTGNVRNGYNRFYIIFQSLLGCFMAHTRYGTTYRGQPFNPFWDASGKKRLAIIYQLLYFQSLLGCFTTRILESKLTSATFNPFWDASIIYLGTRISIIMTSFNPFWDASYSTFNSY